MKDYSHEKCRKECKASIDGALFFCYIAMIILIIIWLFKLIKNSKSEPKDRQRYIGRDPSFFYEEGEFCYDSYLQFISKGAFETFDIRIENINKYSKALVSTILIGLCSYILTLVFSILLEKCHNEWFFCYFCMFYFFLFVSVILSLSFALVLAHHYFKAEFNDFVDFSKCKFLTKQFRIDYDFIFKIKDEFKIPFVIILFTEFLNFVRLVSGFKKEDYMSD